MTKIGTRLTSAPIVAIFTWIWTIGSVIASAFFAFSLFPRIYSARSGAVVEIHFQTNEKYQDPNMEATYFPNTPTFREQHLSQISDRVFLYFSACEALPLSQRPICDSSRNWRRLDPKEVGCSNVVDCAATTHRLSEDERYMVITGVHPVPGASVSLHDVAELSLSDPAAWGKEAKWPIFFVSLFLAIKCGRAIGEFWFTPYRKSEP